MYVGICVVMVVCMCVSVFVCVHVHVHAWVYVFHNSFMLGANQLACPMFCLSCKLGAVNDA